MLDDVSSVAADWVSAPRANWLPELEIFSDAAATMREEARIDRMVARRLLDIWRMDACSWPASSLDSLGAISMVKSWAARRLAQSTAAAKGVVMLRAMTDTRNPASNSATITNAMVRARWPSRRTTRSPSWLPCHAKAAS